MGGIHSPGMQGALRSFIFPPQCPLKDIEKKSRKVKSVHSMCGSVPLKSASMRHVEGNILFDRDLCRAMLTHTEIAFIVCQTPRLGIISGKSTVLGENQTVLHEKKKPQFNE